LFDYGSNRRYGIAWSGENYASNFTASQFARPRDGARRGSPRGRKDSPTCARQVNKTTRRFRTPRPLARILKRRRALLAERIDDALGGLGTAPGQRID